MNNYCNAYFKVNMNEVIRNYGRVQAHIGPGTEILPVLKGNCYGYGLAPMAKLYTEHCGAKTLATATVCEAVQLRRAGIGCKLVVIGGIPQHLLPAVFEFDLQCPLFEAVTARRLNDLAASAGKKARVHIKIETGMNRLGVRPGRPLDELLTLVKSLGNLEVTGIYTHFASSTADYYDPFTLEQFRLFQAAVCQVRAAGFDPQYVHCCNSAALTWFKEARDFSTHVRSCTSILGHESMEDGREPIGLVEPCEIGAYITNIHDVQPGESVGYSQAFTAEKPMTIATLSFGFADGFYPGWMRKQGPVLVSGVRTRLLGCCMDQSFADVTGIPCELGQKVLLVGRDGDERITTWEIEQFCENTFEYLYGTIGIRVERIYDWA